MFVDASDNELNRSLVYKVAFLDILKAINLFGQYQKSERHVAVHYVYCDINDCFFGIVGTRDGIANGKLVLENGTRLNLNMFKSLYETYINTFFNSNEIEEIDSKEVYIERYETWLLFYKLFLSRVINNNQNEDSSYLISLNCILENKKIVIDFNAIYNLKFRFTKSDQNNNIRIATVTRNSIWEFANKIIDLPYPKSENVVLLYGFAADTQSLIEQNETKLLINDSKRRDITFKKVFETLKENGGRVVLLNDISDLLDILNKKNKEFLIHIVTHFHDNRLFTNMPKSIGLGRIEKAIEKMKDNNEFNENIIIDAITCTNFFELRRLYDIGIKYVNMSHNDFSTNLIANMLFELYTGYNAKRLKWDYPYLDGNTHIHEAWSNVSRCFYTTMEKGLKIITY